MTLEETLLQEDMQMVSRMQEAINLIKGSQDRMVLEVHQINLHRLGTKLYFLVIYILVQTLGTWQNIVGNITKTNIMVPVNLLEEIFDEEVMISYS